MTTTFAPATDAGPRTRSERLGQALDLAAAGGRAVLLTGNTADILVASGGALVRNPEWLALWAAGHGWDLLVIDERGLGGQPGVRVVSPPDRAPNAEIDLSAAPLRELLAGAVNAACRGTHSVVLLVDFSCLHLDRDDGELLRSLAELPLDARFRRGGHLLVLAFPTRPPQELAPLPGWVLVDIGLPDITERRLILNGSHERNPVPCDPELPLARVATNLGGLTADAILRLVSEARSGRPLNDTRVAQVKSAEIRRLAGGTLSVESKSRPMTDLAGLANLRLYLTECAAADVPPGVILLAGPPGTGKTRSWLAVADQLGVPPVRLGQLRSRYVGDSENNWATARRVLEATAPSCVLLDEADQTGLGHRSEDLDSGVSSRLRAELWDFLSSCAELGITVIATTNNPAGLDPAALDRVTVLPVLHPTPTEAAQIMAIEARRVGLVLDGDIASVLSTHPGLLTGRQAVRLLNQSARGAAMAGNRGHVTERDVAAALRDLVEIGDDAIQELMALSALLLADSRTAWPWVAASRLGEPVELPRYLNGLLDANGAVDVARVRDRITQLRL